MAPDRPLSEARIKEEGYFAPKIMEEMGKVIVGQHYLLERLLVGLLCNGHILIEGVPGLAKTLAVKTLSQVLQVSFRRIQFTPDLLPADLCGTMIYNPQRGDFTTRKGPIFANIILADEINRAPAKVQSALLEAMQERQVTIGGDSHPLDDPFMVLATQNPIEQEGTYPLPEAQVDRFMLKVKVGYPTRQEERAIMERMASGVLPPVRTVVTADVILHAREVVKQVYLEDRLKDYILHLVFATREPQSYNLNGLKNLIAYGASPRASLYLAMTSRALAFLQGRGYVLPQDIKDMAQDVLRHRVIITYEAEAEEMTAEDVVAKVLQGVEVP